MSRVTLINVHAKSGFPSSLVSAHKSVWFVFWVCLPPFDNLQLVAVFDSYISEARDSIVIFNRGCCSLSVVLRRLSALRHFTVLLEMGSMVIVWIFPSRL
jgi:hypothetical protein